MNHQTLTAEQEHAILTLAASIRGRRNAGRTSPKKARASRRNGKLGGRPRKAVAA